MFAMDMILSCLLHDVATVMFRFGFDFFGSLMESNPFFMAKPRNRCQFQAWTRVPLCAVLFRIVREGGTSRFGDCLDMCLCE